MAEITILDSSTIDKIAAGEVVERPSSVVKELVENAMDAGATAVTVEIKDGGISFIRITDNGCGIEKSQIKKAFMRHATSKIRTVEDLMSVTSLGFRGEALSSISAVAKVEIMTKPEQELIGTRYVIEGAVEKELTEIGVPSGTTILIHNLFYNIPARRKFLKSPATEGGYVADLCEHLALSNPSVSFRFIQNGKLKFQTSGNGDLKEIIYRIYGRDTAKEIVPIDVSTEGMRIYGYLGKPILNRSNRSFENYFMNGRYIKSGFISKAIEDGYKQYLMQHKFPFFVVHFQMDGNLLDVNVHPAKMDIRITNQMHYYDFIVGQVAKALKEENLIPKITWDDKKKSEPKNTTNEKAIPIVEKVEPFEKKRLEAEGIGTKKVAEESSYAVKTLVTPKEPSFKKEPIVSPVIENTVKNEITPKAPVPTQLNLFESKMVEKSIAIQYKIIGQVFDTYWMISYEDKLYFVDQHAAHEKVKYEALLTKLKEDKMETQNLQPPIIMTVSAKEEEKLEEYKLYFNHLGFHYEDFGTNTIALRSIPLDLYGMHEQGLFREILDEVMEMNRTANPTVMEEKMASMACKAAVKGNNSMNFAEMDALLGQLFLLENPYNCPHGRPTMISMTKTELEKKFKRIL